MHWPRGKYNVHVRYFKIFYALYKKITRNEINKKNFINKNNLYNEKLNFCNHAINLTKKKLVLLQIIYSSFYRIQIPDAKATSKYVFKNTQISLQTIFGAGKDKQILCLLLLLQLFKNIYRAPSTVNSKALYNHTYNK